MTRDSACFWLEPPYQEVLATLRSAVASNAGLILFTGDVGSGKSTLVNALFERLESARTIVGRVTYPKPTPLAFLQRLSDVYHLPAADTREDCLAGFGRFLDEAAARKQNVLLVIDEMRSLPSELWAAVDDLLTVAAERTGGPTPGILNVLLAVSDPEESRDSVQARLRPAVKVRCHLRALTKSEVGAYIQYQLKVAGTERALFTPHAVQKIWAFSGGRPGLINMTCYRALLAASQRGAAIVEAEVIDEYVRTLGASIGHGDEAPEPHDERRPRRPVAAGTAAWSNVLVFALAGVVLLGLILIVAGHLRWRLGPARAEREAPIAATGSVSPASPAPLVTPPAAVEVPATATPPPSAGAAEPLPAALAVGPAKRAPEVRRGGGDARAPETAVQPPSAARRPNPAPPRTRDPNDATDPDPAAIIDWLLKEHPTGREQ